MNPTLTDGQKAVLRAFHAFGPMDDVALTVYVHHVEYLDMSSSGIRTRRSELTDKRLLITHGTKRTKSGRLANVWTLNPAAKPLARKLARQARKAREQVAA